jgi:ATP-dependent protease ClpP protease subunit
MSQKEGNYVSGNNVFILDNFRSITTNEMIGDLSDLVMKLEPRDEYKGNVTLKSPYDIDTSKYNVINVFINSNGGDIDILNSIITLLGIAKSKGAIIRTTVCSKAYSCGSVLAIIGTPGFRIMYANAYHLVHFGTQTRTAKQESEIESVTNSMKEHHTNWNNLYLNNTNISQKELKKLMSKDSFVTANKALKYSFCDWIINEKGLIRNK